MGALPFFGGAPRKQSNDIIEGGNMNLTDKIEKILKEKNVDYKFIPLPEDLAPDVASHAAFHGIKMANAMVTILYRTEKGIIAATKRADTQIDQKKFKDIVGVKQLVFASKKDLEELETKVGLVPYLGLDVPYFVDKKVLSVGKIYGTAAEKTMGMAMEAKDLIIVNGGTVADFTVFETKEIPTGKRLLSGITPSGDGSLHIGNYLGAVRQYIELAKSNETYLMVADLHALPTVQDKKQLIHNIETLILNELALLCGFLTEKEFNTIVFFRQSDVPIHAELTTYLHNYTPLGLLKRAHAYKDKLAKDVELDDINMGLFNYPVLMAADILLYKPDLVPVGRDQKQHIEITRDIADRFNKTYKTHTFTLPDGYIPEEVGAVLGTDGKRKMSKSLGNIISIFEDEKKIHKQVMGTYTDPTRKRATDPGHIEGNMVFTYLDFFGDKDKVCELKKRYKEGAVGDVEVKEYLFESLMGYFASARKAYEELKNNPKLVVDILTRGRDRALPIATKTMREVREVIGLSTKYNVENFARRPLAEDKNCKGDAFNTITIDEFAKMEVRVGKVVEAKNKEESEKLIRLKVDISEPKPRVIFTGVRGYGYTPEDFLDKQFFFITNLAPRKMMDEESQGMILAVDSADKSKPLFISAEGMPVGAKIR